MIRYFLKPLFYNSKGYTTPSGEKATSGYPKKNGFGHEEWNNNPNNWFEDADGVRHRVFHLTSLEPDLASGDRVIVFPIYSHNGEQRLLGGLGNAISTGDAEASFIVEKRGFKNRWVDAWKQPRVKKVFKKEETFRKRWDKDLGGLTNWKCPDEYFVWLKEAITISASKITGKKRFIGMFSSYQELDAAQVDKLLSLAGNKTLIEMVERIRSEHEDYERRKEKEDIEDIKKNNRIGKATRLALIEARLGQGRYRAELLKRWKQKCCVTGCTLLAAIRASHIQPWRQSSLTEKLDSENGLPLIATLDALFDRGLISFASSGKMMVSDQLTSNDRQILGLKGLKIDGTLTKKQRYYLGIHRAANKNKGLN